MRRPLAPGWAKEQHLRLFCVYALPLHLLNCYFWGANRQINMKMKRYFLKALTLLIVSSASVSFVSCGSDGDGGGVVDPTPSTPESKSAILGTWVNSVDDMNYILCFNADGTGYYITEGTKQINFTTFNKVEFKFTTAELIGTASSVATVSGVKASGSVEISYVGSSATDYGTFVVTETGKVEFDGLHNINKKIFTQTSSLINTVDIAGLWEGSFSEFQQFSEVLKNTYNAFMRIDSNNTGYLNSYRYTQNIETSDYSNFSGSVIPFTSYVVTGDIIAFKLKDETNTTEEEVTVGLVRYKKNAANGYNVSINGEDEVDIYSNASAADISTNVRGIWVDENEENVMLASTSNNLLYIKKTANSDNNSSFALNDSLIGPYTLLDYNIKVDKSYYQRGKFYPVYRYILANISSRNAFMGIYRSNVYGRFTKVADGSSQLTGRWKLDKDITETYTSTGAIIDNNDIYANNLYQIEFSSNNLFYAYQNAEDVDDRNYKTCYYIATGTGRLFVVEKYNEENNTSSKIRKQYSTETVGSKLYLKYSVKSYYSTEPQEHVIIYTK